jgi:hypothetical protein
LRGDGVKHKSCIIITLLVLISFFSILLPSVSSQDGAVVDISMTGGETQTRFDEPKFIAGIWHYLNVTVINQNVQKLTLKFYEGSSIPAGEKNETNYYEWVYDESNATQWMDAKKYDDDEYIDTTKCVKNSNVYSFYIGIKDTLPNIEFSCENWTLKIYKDDDTQLLHSENIVIEKPTVGIAKGHADKIILNVDPFTVMDAEGDDYFIIYNTGNLPIDLNIDYKGEYDIDVTGSNAKLLPDENFKHYVTFHSKSLRPCTISVNGDGVGQVPDGYKLNLTGGTIIFDSTYGVNVPVLEIHVGHSDYKLVQLGDSEDSISFEYPESISMYEGQIKDDLYVYISGKGSVKLDVTSKNENVKILNLLSEGAHVNNPITIASTAASEHTITVKVEAMSEGKTGTITYTLETDDGTYTYITDITIGPPKTDDGTASNTDSTLQIIVILSIILVIIYMVFSHIKHRRR